MPWWGRLPPQLPTPVPAVTSVGLTPFDQQRNFTSPVSLLWGTSEHRRAGAALPCPYSLLGEPVAGITFTRATLKTESGALPVRLARPASAGGSLKHASAHGQGATVPFAVGPHQRGSQR